MQFKSRDLALMCVFAALYAVLSFISLFPVIGDAGKFITLASVMAPLIGIMLGPYIGVGAVSIGGFIWSLSQTGAFGLLSFVPGASTAFGSGLLSTSKQAWSLVFYVTLFLLMAFYPTIGPWWLYPHYLWFQIIGLIVLASPLTSIAMKFIHEYDNVAKLSFGIGIISLSSTLAGQMTGSLMFELTRWPLVYPQIEYWRTGQWQLLTFVYPFERFIITLTATLIGAPLIRTIRTYGFEVGGK